MSRKLLPLAVRALVALSILVVSPFADTLAAASAVWPKRPISPIAVAKVVFGSTGTRAGKTENHEPFEVDAPMPVPHGLPVPIVFRGRRTAEGERTPHFWAAATTNSLSVLQDFAALDDNNSAVPPDVSGAVGPNHLIVALNTEVRIQTRSGSELARESIRSFFDPIRGAQRVYDPRVVYDGRADRWIACVIADDRTTSTAQRTNSGLLLGISDTGDPTGSWTLYRFVGDSTNVWWLDYPQLGFTDDQIVISANVFGISDGKFKESSVFLISKANPSSGVRVDITDSGGTMTPTISLDPGAPSYLFQAWNGNDSGSGYMRLYSVTASGISPIAWIISAQPWAAEGASAGNFAPQLGSSQLIDAGDERNLTAVYRNGSIWAAGTIFLPANAPTRSSIQWWQVSPSGSIIQHGLIDDPGGGTFYGYPSLAVNSRGDMIIAGSQFSSSMYASSFLASRSSSDPPNTISSPSVFKNGLASYYKSSSSRNRWGDYTTSVVDPANDIDFWTVQEYASTPFAGYDRWGTWWAHVIGSGQGVQPASCTPSTTTLCLSSNRFAVSTTWRTSDGRTGNGTAVSLSGDTGYFWFFNSSNVEMVLKVLNGCGVNSHYWVFAGGLTNVSVTMTVIDTSSGSVKTYTNPLNAAFQPIQDTSAFATCP